MKTLGIMGIDQYGHHYDGLVNPRKDLMNRLCCQHAEKMYVDSVSTGKPEHIGYIVAGLWVRLFTVSTWNNMK